jgi:SAM-dependent methyltransferase
MRKTVIAVIVLCLAGLVQAQSPPDQRTLWNDVYTRLAAGSEPFLPNPFLAKIIEGKKPGKAVDIAMGQGRNALMLAERGWDVTGFDISDVAIGQAKAQAQKRGVKVNAVVADADKFDYGIDQYDLVVAIYAHGALTDRAEDVLRALKRGGLLVVEGVHRESGFYGYESNELLRVIFGRSLTVLHYEDAIGQPDGTWKEPGKDLRFVRLVARKE